MHRIAHLSDLHVLPRSGGERAHAKARKQDTLFKGLIEVVKANPVDALVFTGDLFETNTVEVGAIDRFVKLHAELEAALRGSRPTIILPGNHDRRGSGVFSPWSNELFAELARRFESRPDVHVLGLNAPTLAERVDLPGAPFDVVAYDSTYLTEGFISAGGLIWQQDLLRVGSELVNGDAKRPLLFLLHHHLIPTPITDTTVINTEGRPWLQRLLVGNLMPRLFSNANREEVSMTALGAGSALSTLQTLGRPVLVLHGHKHYATVRLLKGLGGDADLLISSAGTCGMAEGLTGGDFAEAPKIWPSINFVTIENERVDIEARAWSERDPERPSSRRHLVSARWEGTTWVPEPPAAIERAFEPVLMLNETRAALVESKAFVGRLDLLMARKLESHPRATLERYVEVVEGAPGAMVHDIVIDGTPQPAHKAPWRSVLGRDSEARWRVEGAVFTHRHDSESVQGGAPYDWVGLLNISRSAMARLELALGPVKSTPFASLTQLATGQERLVPLRRKGDVVTVEYPNCPARSLLRIYWPLEG
jgi:3',5'-cyclic AMP phosphodiesterase CpdA